MRFFSLYQLAGRVVMQWDETLALMRRQTALPSWRWVLWLALALLLSLAGCGRDEREDAGAPRPVRAVVIEKSKLGETVEMTGSIQPENEAALSFRIGGRMVERFVGTGDAVKAGPIAGAP